MNRLRLTRTLCLPPAGAPGPGLPARPASRLATCKSAGERRGGGCSSVRATTERAVRRTVPGTRWRAAARPQGSPPVCGAHRRGGTRAGGGDTSGRWKRAEVRVNRSDRRCVGPQAADLFSVHSERGWRRAWSPPWRPWRRRVHRTRREVKPRHAKCSLRSGGAMPTWMPHMRTGGQAQHARCICYTHCIDAWPIHHRITSMCRALHTQECSHPGP